MLRLVILLSASDGAVLPYRKNLFAVWPYGYVPSMTKSTKRVALPEDINGNSSFANFITCP